MTTFLVMRYVYRCTGIILVACLAALLILRSYVSSVTCADEFKFFQGDVHGIGHSNDINSVQGGCVADREHAVNVDMSNRTVSAKSLEKKLQEFLAGGGQQKDFAQSIGGIGSSTVPRIIHQSYMTSKLPLELVPFVDSWHRPLRSKGYLFVWWTDDDIAWLVRDHYPQYYEAWKSLYHTIERVDTARYFFLHRYGGIYSDVDMLYQPGKCSTAQDPMQSQEAKVSVKGSKDSEDMEDFFSRYPEAGLYMFKECKSNSLMAGAPDHPFWPFVFQAWTKAEAEASTHDLYQKVGFVSGIQMLRGVCEAVEDKLKPHFSQPVLLPCFQHQHSNSWRWKAKRDDGLHFIDTAIIALLAVSLSCSIAVYGIRHFFQGEKRDMAEALDGKAMV